MDKKIKARSDAATSEQARREALGGALPVSDTNAFHGKGQDDITIFLRHGSENAISASDLAAIAGYGDDTRQLRHAITRARQSGSIILSCNNGYFLPSADAEQRERELRAFKRRFDRILKTNRLNLSPVNKALKKLENSALRGQESLWEADGHAD